jgi:hypothetical protein
MAAQQHHRLEAAVDAELVEEVLHVVPDRRPAHPQVRGHLAGARPPGQESDYLALAQGE